MDRHLFLHRCSLLLCKIRLHDWRIVAARKRRCAACGRRQYLEFYSNRTHEWVTEK